jgi:hypothetical protein
MIWTSDFQKKNETRLQKRIMKRRKLNKAKSPYNPYNMNNNDRVQSRNSGFIPKSRVR